MTHVSEGKVLADDGAPAIGPEMNCHSVVPHSDLQMKRRSRCVGAHSVGAVSIQATTRLHGFVP